jgi:hypothetical protein
VDCTIEEDLFGRVTFNMDELPRRREDREALFTLSTEQSSTGA